MPGPRPGDGRVAGRPPDSVQYLFYSTAQNNTAQEGSFLKQYSARWAHCLVGHESAI